MLAKEIASLLSKARHPPVFGFSDLREALHLGTQLTQLLGGGLKAEFYINFNNRVSLEEVDTLKELTSKGVNIIWDPAITRNIVLVDGTKYVLEGHKLKCLGSSEFHFNKAGFFYIKKAKVISAQRLEERVGFEAVLTLENDDGIEYRLFVSPGILPHGMRFGDTVEVAFLTVVGGKTLAGWDAPAEVFFEALAIRLLHPSSNNPPIVWVTAREVIDHIISGLKLPPAKRNREVEAWQNMAIKQVMSKLREEKIYVDISSERYIYSEIRRIAEASIKHVEPRHHE